MAKLSVQGGATDVTLNVFICDSTAAYPLGLTGLVWNTVGLSCYYSRERTAAAALALANVAVAGAHTDGGFVEIDAANMPGIYRLDLSDAVIATGVRHVTIMLMGAANMVPTVAEIDLDAELGATQGGVAFAGQVSILANVAGQGAFHVRNNNATGIGQWLQGDVGQYNFGTTYGQQNTGQTASGQYNLGNSSGQRNDGTYGQYNTGTRGQYNNGTQTGQYNNGMNYGMINSGATANGIYAYGGVAPLSNDMITASSIAANAIGASEIAANAITSSELDASATAEIADAVLDEVVEGAYTLRQLTRLMTAALYGKVSGGGTVTVTFRDTGDTVNRIVATVDATGNRTAVVLNAL